MKHNHAVQSQVPLGLPMSAGRGQPQGLAYVDGQFVPLNEARIPILDTGFTRSDVTYDVVSVWQGRFFRLEEHLDRFFRNVAVKRFDIGHDREQVGSILHKMVALAGLRDAYVSFTATRGFSTSGSRDPRTMKNTFIAYACPYIWVFSPEQQLRGIRAIIASVERIPATSVDPTVKNYHWGDLVSGTWEALDRGAEACVLLDREGHVTEGAGYNVFAISDGKVITPRDGVLQGITRKTVLELAPSVGLRVQVRDLPADELRAADEVFFATTAGGVMPVGELDGKVIGSGGPGQYTLRLREAYWAAHADPALTTEVAYP